MTVRTATRMFLGHAPEDRGLARLLGERLGRAGFDVEPFDGHRPGEEYEEQLRTVLGSVDQVAFLVTPQFATSEYLALELGAARMARVPISILYDGMAEAEVPDYLRRFPLFRVDEVSRFVDETTQAA